MLTPTLGMSTRMQRIAQAHLPQAHQSLVEAGWATSDGYETARAALAEGICRSDKAQLVAGGIALALINNHVKGEGRDRCPR